MKQRRCKSYFAGVLTCPRRAYLVLPMRRPLGMDIGFPISRRAKVGHPLFAEMRKGLSGPNGTNSPCVIECPRAVQTARVGGVVPPSVETLVRSRTGHGWE